MNFYERYGNVRSFSQQVLDFFPKVGKGNLEELLSKMGSKSPMKATSQETTIYVIIGCVKVGFRQLLDSELACNIIRKKLGKILRKKSREGLLELAETLGHRKFFQKFDFKTLSKFRKELDFQYSGKVGDVNQLTGDILEELLYRGMDELLWDCSSRFLRDFVKELNSLKESNETQTKTGQKRKNYLVHKVLEIVGLVDVGMPIPVSENEDDLLKNRKELKKGITKEEIMQWYWASELKEFCKRNKLRVKGKKSIMARKILEFLNGTHPIKKNKKSKEISIPVELEEMNDVIEIKDEMGAVSAGIDVLDIKSPPIPKIEDVSANIEDNSMEIIPKKKKKAKKKRKIFVPEGPRRFSRRLLKKNDQIKEEDEMEIPEDTEDKEKNSDSIEIIEEKKEMEIGERKEEKPRENKKRKRVEEESSRKRRRYEVRSSDDGDYLENSKGNVEKQVKVIKPLPLPVSVPLPLPVLPIPVLPKPALKKKGVRKRWKKKKPSPPSSNGERKKLPAKKKRSGYQPYRTVVDGKTFVFAKKKVRYGRLKKKEAIKIWKFNPKEGHVIDVDAVLEDFDKYDHFKPIG